MLLLTLLYIFLLGFSTLFSPSVLDPLLRTAGLLVILLINLIKVPQFFRNFAYMISLAYIIVFIPVFIAQFFPGSLVAHVLIPMRYFGRFAGVSLLSFTGAGDTSAYGFYLSSLQLLIFSIIKSDRVMPKVLIIAFYTILVLALISTLFSGNRWPFLVLVILGLLFFEIPKKIKLLLVDERRSRFKLNRWVGCLLLLAILFSSLFSNWNSVSQFLVERNVFDSEVHLEATLQRQSLQSSFLDVFSEERAVFVGDIEHYKENAKSCFTQSSSIIFTPLCNKTNYIDNGFLWLAFRAPFIQSLVFIYILFFHFLLSIRYSLSRSSYLYQIVFLFVWLVKGPHPFSAWGLLVFFLIATCHNPRLLNKEDIRN